ncbi:MAG: DUF6519 domain-containing protein [Alphaproteobacteria bacterium]
MKGDYTRFTFNPDKEYKGVLKQQGRVDLDADWNEQQDIQTYYRETVTGDIIGASGAPENDAGFRVSVDGGEPVFSNGRYYVDGALCLNSVDEVSVTEQPHSPLSELPDTEGRYIAYLDVFDRHITSLEDGSIREVALNGPDTATRIQNVWQVKLLRVGAPGAAFHCMSNNAGWSNLLQGSTAKLSARAKAGLTAAENPCVISPDAGYRRLENQLYRVEIHQGGAHARATWKWSRNNGAQLAKWIGQDGNTIKISQSNGQAFGGFKSGQWIELTDDLRELREEPGTLVRIERVRSNEIIIEAATATGTMDLAEFSSNPKIRGWDSVGELHVNQAGDDEGWILLEDGVQVKFHSGRQKTGDYWLIPARTNTGDIEWPQQGGEPEAVKPHGVEHHYARLALLDLDGGNWKVASDCRELFPALTDLIQLSYVGGDGQSVMPDPAAPNAKLELGMPIQVGVSRGNSPVQGMSVRFKVRSGDGTLNGGAIQQVTVETDGRGVASCRWAIDSLMPIQTLDAELLDVSGSVRHIPVRFHAGLERADLVSYDPVNTPELAGTKTVQEAIDALAKINHEGCTTYVVRPGDNWHDIFNEIKDGEDAHICFQRGVFLLDKPLRIEGKGHLKVTGAGNGSQIIARSQEAALQFVKCAGVSVRDLYIEAGNVGIQGKIKHTLGALTIEDVPQVSIRDVAVKCAGASILRRACITVVKDKGKDAKSVVPAECVTIQDCDLTVGHKQNAILLVNVEKTNVTGNCIKVGKRSKALNLRKQLEAPKMRADVKAMLIGSPVVAEVNLKDGKVNTHKVGSYTLLANSSIPEHEWDALMRKDPPKADDRKSKKNAVKYYERLADEVVEKPSLLKSYERNVKSFEKDIGDAAFNNLTATPHGKAVMRNMLFNGDIRVEEFDEINNVDHNTVISYDGNRVSMNSVLSEKTWLKMLKSENARVGSNEGLLKELQGLAGRLIIDEDFRNRQPEAKKWFGGLVKNNPSVASKGIVCGGSHVGHVFVSQNVVTGVEDCVHIGVSHRTNKTDELDYAKSVFVQDNVIYMSKPVEKVRGNRGVFVGNAHSIRIERNEILLQTNDPKAEFLDGIKIYGDLGRMIMVRENVVKGARVGLRLKALDDGNKNIVRQWLAGDNLFLGASQSAIIAPSSLRQVNNISG